MANNNVALALEAFKIIADLTQRALAARDKARAAAAAAGVSSAELDAADARFAEVYPDPLRELPPSPPQMGEPPGGLPAYNFNRTGPPPSDDVLKEQFRFKATDRLHVNPDINQWQVTESGVMAYPGFRFVREIQ